jgi:hypothetical protein
MPQRQINRLRLPAPEATSPAANRAFRLLHQTADFSRKLPSPALDVNGALGV